MKDVSVYFVSVHSYDIDPHSYDVDPLERGQGFQRAVSVCLQTGSSIIAKILALTITILVTTELMTK